MENDEGFHFLGPNIWSYNTYQEGKEFTPHRILPIPKHQSDTSTCLQHAIVKCLEAVLRLERGKLWPNLTTPTLSIQHCIDVVGRADSAKDSFQKTLDHLVGFGVATESNYPYRGDPDAEVHYDGRTFTYRASNITNKKKDYKPSDSVFMRGLFHWLHNVGPFAGWCYLRKDHIDRFGMDEKNRWTTSSEIKTYSVDGKYVEDAHAVMITGYSVSKDANGVISGYWVFQDNYGTDGGERGMGTMDFNVLHEVFLVEADPSARICY